MGGYVSKQSSPPHVVIATFEFKTVQDKNEFLELLKSDNGLSMTRSCNGCRLIECFEDQSNELRMIVFQKWDREEDHKAYYDKRVASGMVENLKEKLEGEEIRVSRFTPVSA